jgi:hypothetical protein
MVHILPSRGTVSKFSAYFSSKVVASHPCKLEEYIFF